MWKLTDDLGYFASATVLGACARHTRSTVLHFDELTIFDGSIGFALQTESFHYRHVNRPKDTAL